MKTDNNTSLERARYKWSKIFAAKRYGGKDPITLSAVEQDELLQDLLSERSVHQSESVASHTASVGNSIEQLPWYAWDESGMIEGKGGVPIEDVFILRQDVLTLLNQGTTQTERSGEDVSTLMGKSIKGLITVYEGFVSNLEWNLNQNSVVGERKTRAEAHLECFKEILADLKQINQSGNVQVSDTTPAQSEDEPL
jgi:hypothetical protein